jgi:ATP-dependent helicase/nuclease subunit B
VAELILHISRDPHRLLEHAADTFLRPQTAGVPFPSPDHYLILRQGGLRDDLLALAAARRVAGWFDPPIALIQELPALLAELPRKPIGDFERVVLVGRVLHEAAGAAFGRIRDVTAYADAVDRWMGELLGEGVTPVELQSALERAAGRDAFTRGRDAELLRAYTLYHERLADAGLRDPRARLIDCAAAVRADPDAVVTRLGGRRELRLIGLSDPRGGWPTLLRALRDCASLDRVAIYAAERAAFLVSIVDDVVTLDDVSHFASGVFTSATAANATAGDPTAGDAANAADAPKRTAPAPAAPGPTRPVIAMLSAPDLPREVEEIAVRVRRLIDGGVGPHHIAVVSRSARPYAEHVIRALDRVGVPASARLRHALPEVPAIRALLALFHVAAEGWERLGLVELAETPYFRARLDAGVLNHIGYQRRVRGLAAWRAAIERLRDAAVVREHRLEANPDDEEARRNPLPPQERITQALASFAAFTRLAGSLDESRPVTAWLDWLTELLDADEWRLQRTLYSAPGERFDAVRLDVVAWTAMREIIREWRTGEERWGAAGGGNAGRSGVRSADGNAESADRDVAIDVRELEARLRAMLSGDAALFTPARRGVNVLEGLAASFRSFEHVFLVGLDAARVPLRAPLSPLLDEQERAALREAGVAIDTRQQWDEREQALFVNLLATARTSLTLSYARYDETGAEQLPSAFFEEVQFATDATVQDIAGARAFTPGVPLASGAAALEHALQAAHAEHARAADTVSPYNGRMEHGPVRDWIARELGEARVWSPTQIEAYAKCPWAYFSGRLLRLEKLEDPDLDIDPMTRGSILHDALRRFYDAARERTGAAVHLRGSDLDWARPLAEQAIADAIDAARESVWVGHPALEAQKLAELKRQLVSYIEWEADENDDAVNRPRTNAAKYVKTDVDEHEVSFDEVELDVDGVRVRFRGFIDRVEVGNDARGQTGHMVAAVDYKSSEWSTPASGKPGGWKDGVVLQVPLYAHALAQIRPGTVAARVEYRSIKGRKRVHQLPLYLVTKDGLVEDPKAREKYEQALSDVARQVTAARDGTFTPLPPPSCNCPPFCHARDICRIAGGPRE